MTAPNGAVKHTVALAVVGALAVVLFVLATFTSIGASYLVTEHQINSTISAQTQLREQEIKDQLKAAIPMCKALRELADIRAKTTGAYGKALQKGFTDVFTSTGCKYILEGKIPPTDSRGG